MRLEYCPGIAMDVPSDEVSFWESKGWKVPRAPEAKAESIEKEEAKPKVKKATAKKK